MPSQKDVPFLEKGTKNPALASGCGFAGWKAAAGSHPHAARRSGKGRFVSGSWMAARSFGTSAKGRRRYRQRQTLSPTGLSTGRLCADNLAGSRGAWDGDLTLGGDGIAGADAWVAMARMVWWEARARSVAVWCGRVGRARFRSNALRSVTVLTGARNRSHRFHRSKNRLCRLGQPVCRLFGIRFRSSSRGARRARGTLRTPLPYRRS